ncbi:MAG: SprT-like domain-containing protein, partial [Prevotella sp.]|nr:SprT-like domain-containing protein [Prevotella sp.]
GTMSYRRVRKLLRWTYTDFTIRISTYYECSEREYQETLLHEMIHYYIAYKNISDTSSHGKVFRQIMQQLNNEHGWNITITSSMHNHKLTPVQRKITVANYFLVLAIELDDGGRMFTVVNKKAIRKVYDALRNCRNIVNHRWYVSLDPYFLGFPCVRSLRARRVSIDVYNEKTAAMQPLALKEP